MLILASKSPRRSEILRMLGFEFQVCPSNALENADFSVGIDAGVMELALTKARAVAKDYLRDVVLGADTLVALDGRILGQPKNREQAAQMLRLLSGKTHTVYTGAAILGQSRETVFCHQASVCFFELSDREIDGYIDTGEPMDKAGAYGIQGRGCTLVREIHGDFYTVMGLPAARVSRELAGFGVLPKGRCN